MLYRLANLALYCLLLEPRIHDLSLTNIDTFSVKILSTLRLFDVVRRYAHLDSCAVARTILDLGFFPKKGTKKYQHVFERADHLRQEGENLKEHIDARVLDSYPEEQRFFPLVFGFLFPLKSFSECYY